MNVTRPALRYHGGKWKLAPWIIQHFPRHRVYLEAYGGAGSVLFRKPRSFAEVYNDLWGEIVEVFRVLQDPQSAAELERLLRVTPFSRAEREVAYEESADPVERARRMIIRSQMGFGSDSCRRLRRTGFRNSACRRGTTPAVDWSRYPDHVQSFTARLEGVVLEQRPATELLRQFDGRDTLHYLDPPYQSDTRSEIRGYEHELTDDNHRELAERVHGLKGYVVISGYRCELYDGLYRGWPRVDRDVIVFRAARRVRELVVVATDGAGVGYDAAVSAGEWDQVRLALAPPPPHPPHSRHLPPQGGKKAVEATPMKADCRMAVLEELCAGEPLSLGDLVRVLQPTWSQSAIESQLRVLMGRDEIEQSQRVDYVRSQRLRVVTYKIR